MDLRGSQSDQTGNIGAAAVTLKFHRLNWHVAPNPAGEVGTDLLLQVRDDRRFDLGAIVGAQVKSGPSYFREVKRGAGGEVEGWWFRDDDAKHLKYWMNHTAPHLLVLHDESDDTSYWVHVTAERVIPAGEGAKILVPKASTVDADHIDEILAIGTSVRVGARWEGSAWDGGDRVLPQDQLRYALVTPRLIAPHPNRTPSEFKAHEAIALLIKMRLRDLQRSPFDNSRRVPSLEDCRASGEWRWRLYAALYDVLLNAEDSGTVEALIDTADASYQRAAVAAICCALRVENLDPSGGIAVIDSVLVRDDCSPVDHDWLLTHKARCLNELGDLDGARSIGFDVQRLRVVDPDDPTAMAIVGSGVDVVSASRQLGASLSDIINGRDTIASWWRTQEIAWGLQDHFNDHFTAWVKDAPAGAEMYGSTWRRLRAASLAAGMAADHSSWRHTSALIAKHVLTLAADTPADVVAALIALQRAGDRESIQEAVEHVLRSGPAEAVQRAAEEAHLKQATRTSVRATLQLIESAADVLTTETADRAARWLLSVLADWQEFRVRMRPSFTSPIVIDTLAELVGVVSPSVQRAVITHLLELEDDNDAVASHWAKVIDRLPSAAWNDDDREALLVRVADSTDLAALFTRVVAEGDPGYRQQLLPKIREGNLAALGAFGKVTDLDEETARGLTEHLAERTRELTVQLRGGENRIGGYDPADTLIIINAWHPASACWEPIIDLLSQPLSFPMRLARPLISLRRLKDNIPERVASALVEPLRNQMLHGTSSWAQDDDVRGEAASTLAVLRPSAITDAELLDLIHAEDLTRRGAAIRLIASRGDANAFDTLWAMSRDQDPWVRAIVANQLAAQCASHSDNDRFADLLGRLSSGGGTLVARMVATTLKDQPRSGAGDQLANVLRDHLSAEVRRAVARYEEQVAS